MQIESRGIGPLGLVFIGGVFSDPLEYLGEELLLGALVLEDLVETVLEDKRVFLFGVGELVETFDLFLGLYLIACAVEHE